jgi:hypothetical protein
MEAEVVSRMLGFHLELTRLVPYKEDFIDLYIYEY